MAQSNYLIVKGNMGKRPFLLLFILILALFTIVACRRQKPTLLGERSQTTLKIEINQNGLYRIPLLSLQEAGWEDLIELTPDQIALSQNNNPIPYLIDGTDLIFYAQSIPNRYQATTPYIISKGVAGLLIPTQEKFSTNGLPPIEIITQTIHLEENHFYVGQSVNNPDEEDPWFWTTIHIDTKFNTEFTIPQLTTKDGSIRLKLWGKTEDRANELDHDLELSLNGNSLNPVLWDGQQSTIATIPIPASFLQQDLNNLLLDNPTQISPEGKLSVDIMELDWIEINYQTEPLPMNGRLAFTVPHDGLLSWQGFSSAPFIFDITNPSEPIQLSTESKLISGQQIVASATEGFLSPVSMLPARQTDWDEPEHQIDLIILTTDELAPALTPLVEKRKAEGLFVAVVAVEELYDSFGAGNKTPETINNFLHYAYNEWAQRPHYLFIVGDSSSDYRGYLTTHPDNPVPQPTNLIPAPMVQVPYSGETVSDPLMADVTGDGVADFAVGRWPVSTVAAVDSLVERTLAYEKESPPNAAIFAADKSSSEFSSLANRLLTQTSFPLDETLKLYQPNTETLNNAWNAGSWLITYIGHGSITLWGKDELFSTKLIDTLKSTKGSSPIVLQLTCLTGLFSHPTQTSLSELLLQQKNGPVITVAATSLTLSSKQEPFAVGLINNLQDSEYMRIGDAFQQAKEELDLPNRPHLKEINDTFHLFADPTAHIMRPEGATR